MTIARRMLELLASCLLYSLAVILIDSVLILFALRELAQIIFFLSLTTLIEGALGLVIGGTLAFYSPSIAKVGEVLLHSEPWNAARQKNAEKQARIWICTGGFLAISGLLVSAI